MSLPSDAVRATVNPELSRGAGTHRGGCGRILMRAGVGAVTLLGLGTLLIRLPTFMTHVQSACASSRCAYGQLTSPAVAALNDLGLSLGAYAVFQIVLPLLWAVLGLTLAALIVWRKSDDWMALLVAMLLVVWPAGIVTGVYSLGTYSALEGSQFPNPLVNWLLRFGFFVIFSLFPTGRLVSRWTLVPLGVLLFLETGYNFLQANTWAIAQGWPNLLADLLWPAALLSLVPIQWYRYRHLSTAIERQQLKWAALGVSIVTAGFMLRYLLLLPIPQLHSMLYQSSSLYNSLSTLFLLYVSLVIPLSIGLAILRYRLWDVDVLINKALVYGGLSGTLVVVYTVLVIGLGSLVGQFTTQPLVIIISTLITVALFRPLRRRIQRLIDRRFYRKKYDAAKTLAALSATMSNEVDLEQLSTQLLEVVNSTMQPTFVSLWLRPPAHDRTQRNAWRAAPLVSSAGR